MSERERITPEDLARYFHEEYERMAPSFSYETRQETRVPWDRLLDSNKQLMCAVSASVLLKFFPDRMAVFFSHPATEEELNAQHRLDRSYVPEADHLGNV